MRKSLILALFFATTAIAKGQGSSRAEWFHRILLAEDQRLSNSEVLANALEQNDVAIVARATLALGRIGDPASTSTLVALLSHPAADVRDQASFSLGLMGGKDAREAIRKAYEAEKVTITAAHMLTDLARVAEDVTEVNFLAAQLHQAKHPVTMFGIAHGFVFLMRKWKSEWSLPATLWDDLVRLLDLGGRPAVAAAYALARYPGDWAKISDVVKDQVVHQFLAAKDLEVKAVLARAVSKLATTKANDALFSVLHDSRSAKGVHLRAEIYRGLGAQTWSENVAQALATGIRAEPALVQSEIFPVISKFADQAASIVGDVQSCWATCASGAVRGLALEALVAIDHEKFRAAADAALQSGDVWVRISAVHALKALGTALDKKKLLELANGNDARIAAEALDALSDTQFEGSSEDLRQAYLAALRSDDVAKTAIAADTMGKWHWVEAIDPLAQALDRFALGDFVEVRHAIVAALGEMADPRVMPTLEKAMLDPERMVVEAAAAAILKISGKNVSQQIPLASKQSFAVPSQAEIKRALDRKIEIRTNQGNIEIKLLPDAPMAAYNFVRLAQKGYYDGTPFHRVIAHFVAQGGDPLGNGMGGPGYLIRDAVSRTGHERGTIGMATAGKDTAGSQYFFNHSYNMHLDGAYTVFAYVTRGMDVVDRLFMGDGVVHMKVK